MLLSHFDTHLPLLLCPSFRFREKLKQVNPRYLSLLFSCPSFLLPPHQAMSFFLPLSLSLSSSHSAGQRSGQNRSHDKALGCTIIPPPQLHRPMAPLAVCRSSHPTIDSCLHPLMLSPLRFSWKTMCCMICRHTPGFLRACEITCHTFCFCKQRGQFLSFTHEKVMFV